MYGLFSPFGFQVRPLFSVFCLTSLASTFDISAPISSCLYNYRSCLNFWLSLITHCSFFWINSGKQVLANRWMTPLSLFFSLDRNSLYQNDMCTWKDFVGRIWSWAAMMNPFDSSFNPKLDNYWWACFLSTSMSWVCNGYWPGKDCSSHLVFRLVRTLFFVFLFDVFISTFGISVPISSCLYSYRSCLNLWISCSFFLD